MRWKVAAPGNLASENKEAQNWQFKKKFNLVRYKNPPSEGREAIKKLPLQRK